MRTAFLHAIFLLIFIPTTNAQSSLQQTNEIDSNVVTVKPKSTKSKYLESLKVIRSNILGYYDISVPDNIDVNKYVSVLMESGEFETVDFNYISRIKRVEEKQYLKQSISLCSEEQPIRNEISSINPIIPNDPNFVHQVLLEKIKVPDSWNITMGNPSVKVAIIDTGIDSTHVDLGFGSDGYSNISTTIGINCDLWLDSHGTQVAGIIGAKTNNGVGMSGIAGGNNSNGATLVPYFVSHFYDPMVINWSLVDDYIVDATIDGVDIIYIGYVIEETNSAMSSAINYAYNHGVVIVCGTGDYSMSEGEKPIVYPAANDKVIAVGACEFFQTFGEDYRYINFSAYGPEIDLVAPGYYGYTTLLNQSYTPFAIGTHIAAAHVAGVVALMLSVNPQLTPAQVKQILRDTAIKSNYYSYTNGWNQYVGCGLVDAYAAVLGAYLINISGPDRLCGEEIYTISGIPAGASVSLGTNTGGFWIQKSSNISFDSYNSTTGELSVQQTTPGDGYIKVYYDDHLLATKEFWVGGPKITNFYYTGNTLYVESDGGLRYYWNINGTQFSSLSQKYYPLADGTYNVSVYTTSPNCGAGPTYTTQLHVSGGNMYSLGAISSDHQVSIETIDYSDSPQPLEAMQTMTSKQAAKDVVPYELKNAMTGEVSARGEMPAEGGVLDFSRVRSGLYVLTLSPAGREPETFKISLK